MTQSVAPPQPPTNPETIKAPTLELATVPFPEAPADFYQRCKEVAKVVKQFVRTTPSLKMRLDGKKYAYAPVWQFAAACFGITPMVTSTEELLTDDRKEMGYLATAHAIDRTGRVISGADATCMCAEEDWQNKPSFQLRSMAETRACTKVLSNILRYVMVMAGFCPTPADEISGPGFGDKRHELTTPCDTCGNKVSAKRRAASRKKFGFSYCLACEKKELEKQGEAMLKPINDPEFVAQSVAQVAARKANGAQPIAGVLDAGEEDIA